VFGVFFVGMMLVAAAILMGTVKRLAEELPRRRQFTTLPTAVVPALIAVLGSVAVTRFDVVPTTLMVLSLLLVIKGRHSLGGAALGAAIAVKLYPAFVLPLVVTYVARRAGYRAAAGVAALAVGVVAAAYTPFLLVSARGVRESLYVQLSRSLEIESVGGALFVAAHRVFGIPLDKQPYYYDFPSHSAHVIGIVEAAIGLVIVLALWIGHARAPASPPSLVRYAAATIAVFIVFGRVLSPQYLVWLIPLVPLVVGKRGLVATSLLGLACLLTAIFFPRLWDPALLRHLAATPLALLVSRGLLLVGLVGVLSWPATSRYDRRGSSVHSGSHAEDKPLANRRT
jgi:uncharacterized membrane protein